METTPELELRRCDGNAGTTSDQHSVTDLIGSLHRLAANSCGFFSTAAKLLAAAAEPLQCLILQLLAVIVHR